MILASWSDKQFIKGFTCISSYIMMSTKIVSVNVPLLLIVLVGKSTTCVILNVFVRVIAFYKEVYG